MEKIPDKRTAVPRIPDEIDFPSAEREILKYWRQIRAFETSLEQSKDKPRYTFYDGPPFATGLPHYGHILAGTIKDVVTRYAHQMGYHVERRFGWDCHGLPVEYEIDQQFDIKGPSDVAKMGISVYNDHCREIVTKYADEWEKTMTRIGRWVDFQNDYKTMYPWYMESIWWVFKQLYVKGLVYQGYKIMPYSNACGTPLSNFEAGQNYKEVTDPAIVVALPLVDYPNEAHLLIWTTTPWTLPSNLAVCVHPQLTYALFRQKSTQKYYIMLQSRIEVYFSLVDCEIIRTFPGFDLKGLCYSPIFPYYRSLHDSGAFRVLADEYVTADTGTGIVHQAPYFGEDDYRVCLMNGVIQKDQEPICPLDTNGFFIAPVYDFAGIYVKNADDKIIAYLKKKGLVVRHAQIQHSYPFCWRSDTPLIYRSVKSWFIRVEHMRDLLVENAGRSRWVPEYVRDKRFANWLSEARDWAVSRNRYWGTPIPIWMSDDEIRCIESIEELEILTGTKITDLHRDTIDDLLVPSSVEGKPDLKRIPEVFDCWFESGCMPYAQAHFPFENSDNFHEKFPADFVAEGIDQTRGWFYTLLVISTALFHRPPYKNLIVNGLVLAADGQKMSKRKKNFPDPMQIINKFGADPLRLYLINSPVVRAENLRFKEEGVKETIKDVFLPWYNAFRFLIQNIELLETKSKCSFFYRDLQRETMTTMDRWIVSFTQSLLDQVATEMSLYHLYKVVPQLTKYFEKLTNWYIRMNRKRLKGEVTLKDAHASLSTLYNVLFTIIQLMAPFTPFLSEKMYLIMKIFTDSEPASVHHLMLPKSDKKLIDPNIERSVKRMQSVIELARIVREQNNAPLRYQLPELVVVHQDEQYLQDIQNLKPYILSELNILTLTITSDKSQYGITLKAEPDFKSLGTRLKGDMKLVQNIIKGMTDEQIADFKQNGRMHVNTHEILLEHVRITYETQGIQRENYKLNSDNDVVILLDVTLNEEMIDQGIARDLVNRIQKLRKKGRLLPTDDIMVYYDVSGELDKICRDYKDFIEFAIKAEFKPLKKMPFEDVLIVQERQMLKNCVLDLVICRHVEQMMVPTVRWANLHVINLKPRQGSSNKGLILLEAAGKKIDLQMLRKSIFTLFGLESYSLMTRDKTTLENKDLRTMDGDTIYITPVNGPVEMPDEFPIIPYCKVHNFMKNGVQGTIVLENPQGSPLLSNARRDEMIDEWVSNVERKYTDIV